MVIAVVSLLSTIVLGSLNDAREKGRIAAGQKFASSLHHSIGDELVGEWKFDQDNADDSSGWGNDGSLEGGLGGGDFVDDMMGRALEFDGSGYVKIAHSSLFDLDQLSIELWIKTPVSFGGLYRALVSKQQGADRDYNFYARSSDASRVTDLHFSSARWGSSLFTLPKPYSPDTWHHVAITVDHTGLEKYYSDGAFLNQHQGTSATANNNYPLWIGAADNYWNGRIDNVRIYSKALTSAEIQKHYAEGLADHPTLASNNIFNE